MKNLSCYQTRTSVLSKSWTIDSNWTKNEAHNEYKHSPPIAACKKLWSLEKMRNDNSVVSKLHRNDFLNNSFHFDCDRLNVALQKFPKQLQNYGKQ